MTLIPVGPRIIPLPGPPTVVLIRHAEPGGGGNDPSLSPAGQARAQELRHVLGDTGVTAIFVSALQRTQQTAAPLAADLGITPSAVGSAGEIVTAISALSSAGVALVVGHTDTVPVVIAGLSGGSVTIAPTEFDRLFVLCRKLLIRLRYGA